jgi:hypothetical protein
MERASNHLRAFVKSADSFFGCGASPTARSRPTIQFERPLSRARYAGTIGPGAKSLDAKFGRNRMHPEDNPCSNCSGGCSAGKTEAKQDEEISAGLYLLLGAAVIVAASILAARLFGWMG